MNKQIRNTTSVVGNKNDKVDRTADVEKFCVFEFPEISRPLH